MRRLESSLGLGVSWRPELALFIDRYPKLGFIELLAENFPTEQPLPAAVLRLCQRGVRAIPHGVGLSLGGAEAPTIQRIRYLENLADRVNAPLISEHLAFVRCQDLESGHLLPLERSQDALEIVVENIRLIQSQLSYPFYIENIACILELPGAQWDEASFLCQVLEKADCGLLLDISNLYANCHNHQQDAIDFLKRIPLDRIGYVHIGGGMEHDGLYHDTHAGDIPAGALDLLTELVSICPPPGVLWEHDSNFPNEEEFMSVMNRIEEAIEKGAKNRAR